MTALQDRCMLPKPSLSRTITPGHLLIRRRTHLPIEFASGYMAAVMSSPEVLCNLCQQYFRQGRLLFVVGCGILWVRCTTLGKLSVFLFCTCWNIFGMNSILWYEGELVTQTKECMIYQIIMQKMVQNMVNLSIYSQQM